MTFKEWKNKYKKQWDKYIDITGFKPTPSRLDEYENDFVWEELDDKEKIKLVKSMIELESIKFEGEENE